MDKPLSSPKGSDEQAIRHQLSRILASEQFVHGPRQIRFLTYIVEATLAGRADRLNQFAVGIEVFDRDESFDPSTDSIVRVEAGRLRSKLAEYYSDAGSRDPVVISMPKGGYGVAITFRSEAPDLSAPKQGSPRHNVAIGFLLATILLGSVYFGFFRPVPPSGGAPAADQGEAAIAILPFDNMSADPAQEYFSDGITEDIITDLSILSDLTVIARRSTFVYKERPASITDVGRDLGVRYVVEGSVRRDADRLRITATLIDVDTQTHLWAERFDRDVDDVFAIQEEVSREIVDALEITLTEVEQERLGHRGTDSVAAHDLLLRGQEQFYRFTPHGVSEAISLFEQARSIDATYAEAYAWQSRALVYAYISGINQSHSLTIAPAVSLAQRAIELDEMLPLAHANLGWSLRWNDDVQRGIAALSRATELDPNFADAYLWLSLILSPLGRGDEALAAIRRSLRIDPHYDVTHVFALGRAHLVLGDYGEALEHFERGIARNPNFVPNHVFKVLALEALDEREEAAAATEFLARTNPEYEQSASYRIYLLERAALGTIE